MSAQLHVPRDGDWIQTFSGYPFWPLAPRPEDVRLEDVAHMLSMKVRFSGSVRFFYSVAQHAVILSHVVPSELAYAALHHDDGEAYLPGFKAIERAVENATFITFGVNVALLPRVKEYDRRIVADEAKALLNPTVIPWRSKPVPLGVRIRPWSPRKAKRKFLERHRELTGKKLGWLGRAGSAMLDLVG